MMNQRHSRIVGLAVVLASAGCAGAQVGSLQEANELNRQVEQLDGQGRYREAIPPAERALAIREQALGPTHPDTAQALNNLAGLYQATGAYGRAEPLLQRALGYCQLAQEAEIR